jgi:hypothetical protein
VTGTAATTLSNIKTAPVLISSVTVRDCTDNSAITTGTLPLTITLEKDCWLDFNGDPLRIDCLPPTFTNDSNTVSSLPTGIVRLVETLNDTEGHQIIHFNKGVATPRYTPITVNLKKTYKYLYFYTDGSFYMYHTNLTGTQVLYPKLVNRETGTEYILEDLA